MVGAGEETTHRIALKRKRRRDRGEKAIESKPISWVTGVVRVGKADSVTFSLKLDWRRRTWQWVWGWGPKRPRR